MMIMVEDMDGNTIFRGDADDFLFENDNDMDLEIILNDLESEKVGTTINAYNSDNEVVSITKAVGCIR